MPWVVDEMRRGFVDRARRYAGRDGLLLQIRQEAVERQAVVAGGRARGWGCHRSGWHHGRFGRGLGRCRRRTCQPRRNRCNHGSTSRQGDRHRHHGLTAEGGIPYTGRAVAWPPHRMCRGQDLPSDRFCCPLSSCEHAWSQPDDRRIPPTRRPRYGTGTRKVAAGSPRSTARLRGRRMTRNCRSAAIRCSFIRWRRRTASRSR